ncbi:hypothetical protein BXY66_1987 [Shimia isoporae]|uniref:Uncharacterized protein n=1 Tax=Shimia isoporae TaxID=647720 RepID=A0A4V2Q463_9RHOB|nr:hypothetical protein [Shimia isoporae]TCL09920.1 hypothetical protein BXY66_1987 [Shimia isoporae]
MKTVAIAGLFALSSGTVLANTNALKNPVNGLPEPGSFEVVTKWTVKTDYIWCAAAQAALQRGARYKDRIYVVHGLGPSRTMPGENAVGFTYRPDASLRSRATSGSSLQSVGNNMSVSQGNRRCVRELDG